MTALPRRARNVLRSLVLLHLDAVDQDSLRHPRAWWHAVTTLWAARLDMVAFLRNGDLGLAHDLRRRFGLAVPLDAAQPIPDDLFEWRQTEMPLGPATIVIPIYNAVEEVASLLKRLPSTLPNDQSVILVNDGSTDPRIRDEIASFAQTWPHTHVIHLEQNKGFVHAVNTAVSHLPPGHHAILLNSDTVPPKDWVPRLLAPFAFDDDIATVTPLSNAAEVLSVPTADIADPPTVDLIETMDAVAKRLRPRQIELPTGIGFCMALNRRFLDLVGPFDSTFGKGYGEEVDWCQKASALGGRHAVASNLVVGHHGAASFGGANRTAQVAKANRIIERRYPNYNASVSAWAASAPIAPERLAISMGWVAHNATSTVPVFIGHALGGGAETALKEEIARAHRDGSENAVVLRVGGPSAWRLELHNSRFQLMGDIDDIAVLHQMLAPLERRHIVYSCAVHASNPATVPDVLLALAKGHRLSVRFHDFFPISPSWNLLGSDGKHSGVPPLATEDPAHAVPPIKDRPGLSHAEWRTRWGNVMAAADEFTVFSRSSGALVREAYPQVGDTLRVRPHAVVTVPPRLSNGGQTLGVLGGINHAKGGAVLQSLTRVWNRRIAIIGELDGCFTLPHPHVVHGRYAQTDIARLAGKYDVGAWFIPSICPETFSFATHEALATGLPVACFNLGAQAETLSAAPSGHVIDLEPDDTRAIAARLDQLFATP